jgi:acetyl esterase/lipase
MYYRGYANPRAAYCQAGPNRDDRAPLQMALRNLSAAADGKSRALISPRKIPGLRMRTSRRVRAAPVRLSRRLRRNPPASAWRIRGAPPSPAATMTAPTLILIGEADDWTSAERCREMVAHARPDGAPIALTVYPGAHHSFDVPLLQPGVRYRGHWLEYDEPAAKDAEEKTRAFLATHFAGTPAGEPPAK